MDLLSPRVVLWTVSLMLMSAADAFMTLAHLRIGAEEVVPTMRLALSHGDATFLISKLVLTAVGAVYLSAHQHFSLARVAFRLLLAVYLFVMAYHSFLIALHW